MSRAALSRGRQTELLALLCTAVVSIVTNMTMLGPLLLQLADEFQVSLSEAGLLMSVTALPWALSAPLLGPLSDRFGRRRVLAFSLAGLGLATLIGSQAPSYAAMVLLRVVSGVLASPGPTSLMAAVGDHFPPARRATALGWVNSGFGLAALGGVPLAGAIGGALGWRAAFALMGTASVFLALLIWVRLPESSLERSRPGALIGAYRVVLRSRGLPQILLANIFERSVFSIVGGFTAAFLMQTYGLDLLHVAPLLALAAVGTIVGNVVGGRLADRQAQARVYAQGQILSAGFGLLLYVTSLGPLASVLLCIGFGLTNAASRPAILAMTSALAPQHRGTAIGVFSLTNQLGWALGPAAAGLAYALAGYSAIGLLCGAAAAGAGLMMLPLLRR